MCVLIVYIGNIFIYFDIKRIPNFQRDLLLKGLAEIISWKQNFMQTENNKSLWFYCQDRGKQKKKENKWKKNFCWIKYILDY